MLDDSGTKVDRETYDFSAELVIGDLAWQLSSLKCNDGFTGAGCHGDQYAGFVLQYRLYHMVYRDLLVIARCITGNMIVRRKQSINRCPRQAFGFLQP